ncbi:hypothetical protein HDV00_008670 [Rhizophlyctis rosea]|nr:hypothetical protein HDV00_008670 [Rhizophlyctis rosea]
MADDNDVFAGQLRLMNGMGFTDNDVNRRALKQTAGKLYAAVDLIVEGKVKETDDDDDIPLGTRLLNSPPRARTPPPAVRYRFPPLSVDAQKKIVQLHQMGFKDEGKSRHALSKTNWDPEGAAVLLLDKADELDSGFSAIEVIRTPNPTEQLATLGSTSSGFGTNNFSTSPSFSNLNTFSSSYGAPQPAMNADPFGDLTSSFNTQPSVAYGYQQPSLNYQQPTPSFQQPTYNAYQSPAANLFQPAAIQPSYAASQPAARTAPDPFDPFGDEYSIEPARVSQGNPFTSPASGGFPPTAAAPSMAGATQFGDPAFLRQQLRPTGYQLK